MYRYYSDSDDEYAVSRRRSDSVQASGWQSPLQTTSSSSPPSSVTRIVVEPPFGSRKCDYSIDKSQRGRLVITARRRPTDSSNQKKQVAVQTFTIPLDADVDQLQSRIEHDTNRLIIEIPRTQQRQQKRRQSRTVLQNTSYTDANNRSSRLLRSPDVERMLTSPTSAPNLIRDETRSNTKASDTKRKLEYRIDCRGYNADELEVFIQGRDLMVQGKTKTSTSSDPTQQRVSKKFTRKITLPNTVDLVNVVSYLEQGELRIEAPLKRGVYYTDEEIIIPGPPPTSTRTATSLTSNFENRVRSPSPVQTRSQHFRRNERTTRRRDYDRSNHRRVSSPMRRVRSIESQRYPYYISSRDLDEADEDNEAYAVIHRRSIYSPANTPKNDTRTSVISRRSEHHSDDDNELKF